MPFTSFTVLSHAPSALAPSTLVSADELEYIRSEEALKFLAEQPPHPRKPWAAIFPDASAKAVDLLDRMLQFHPAKRISVEDAIGHPYFDSVRGCVPGDSCRLFVYRCNERRCFDAAVARWTSPPVTPNHAVGSLTPLNPRLNPPTLRCLDSPTCLPAAPAVSTRTRTRSCPWARAASSSASRQTTRLT